MMGAIIIFLIIPVLVVLAAYFRQDKGARETTGFRAFAEDPDLDGSYSAVESNIFHNL